MIKTQYSLNELLKLEKQNKLKDLIGYEFKLLSKQTPNRPMPFYHGIIISYQYNTGFNCVEFWFLHNDGTKSKFYIDDSWMLEII